jgi:hypothetical protein
MTSGQCQCVAVVTSKCFFRQSRGGGKLKTPCIGGLSLLPVLTYTRKYRNLSLVTSTENVVQHFTRASIRKMQLVTESQQKKMHETNEANRKQRSRWPGQNSKNDILKTQPIKNRSENNLIGQARNDVIELRPICP